MKRGKPNHYGATAPNTQQGRSTMNKRKDHSEVVGNQGKKKTKKTAADMGAALRRRLCEEQRERKANNWWGE